MYIISQQVTADGKLILNLAGKSSETKPTGGVVADGSTFLEENTDAFWKLDGTWKLEKAGQMKDLPVVDSGDNGKVMKVAEGAWAVGLDNGLPLSFPAEGAANANKFVGFDANGDYTAKDAPEELPSITGKNGKILGVTLDAQEHEQTEWIDAPQSGGSLPANFPEEDIDNAGALIGFDENGDYEVKLYPQPSQLIVRMNLDDPDSPTKLVSDLTFGAIHTAAVGGKTVIVVLPGSTSATTILDCSRDELSRDITIYFLSSGTVANATGGDEDYIEFPI